MEQLPQVSTKKPAKYKKYFREFTIKSPRL